MKFNTEKVRSLMRAWNLSQEQLAGKIGVTRQAVNAVLSGRHNASLKTITVFAAALGVAPEELLEKNHVHANPQKP